VTDHDTILALTDRLLRTTNMDSATELATAFGRCCKSKTRGEIQMALAVILSAVMDGAPPGLPVEIILGVVEELATRIHRCELPTFGTA
jgi:hypothetical protein